MLEQVRYITDENGNQVGVLLDISSYRRLIALKTNDPELLIGLSQDELEALADSQLAPESQVQLDDLLARNQDGQLNSVDEEQLDNLLAQLDQLTLLKTRAKYTLANQVARAE